MNHTNFARTGMLTRFGLRRDRMRLVVWIIILAGLMVTAAAELDTVYGTQNEIQAIVNTLKSPGMVSLFGAFALEGRVSTAQVFANEMLLFMALAQIIMNFALAVRATRAEEDSGVTEMIRAHAVGKLAPLAAAGFELLLVNSLIGVLYGLGLSAGDLPGADPGGNWLMGLALAACGLMFGMMALAVAQVADHAGSATGIAYMLFGITFLVRMITDVENPDYTWWSPLGWIEKTLPYTDNNWIPVGYMALAAAALFLIALYANLHRDMGAGALSTRPGRRTASPILAGPATLFLRLVRTTVIAWILGVFAVGAMYGSIFGTIGDILKTNPTMQQVFGKAAVNSANHTILLNFLGLLTIIFAVLAAIPAIQMMNRLKKDESKGLLEVIYAKPVSRTRQFFTCLLTGMVSGALVFLAGLGGTVVTGNSVLKSEAERITGSEFWTAFWGMLPAILVMVACAALLVGWLPRLTGVLWLYLAYGFIALYLGNLLQLPDWAKQLVPFGWPPEVPVHDVNGATFWWMIALSIVLVIAGLIGYRHRDLNMG
jgi:ABC-2 type transport system permease protein